MVCEEREIKDSGKSYKAMAFYRILYINIVKAHTNRDSVMAWHSPRPRENNDTEKMKERSQTWRCSCPNWGSLPLPRAASWGSQPWGSN